ncbi:MAG: L-rhamnose mutarotase [Sediminibacterium sp.]|nr:MAG: L-rhamnose mutarotase [Sediminibacterium sp.]
MKQIAFEMKLIAGNEAEYKKRHDNIWPELYALLKTTGISEYSIYLNEETGSLFGVMKIEDDLALDALPQHPMMQKWWAYMKDIMLTHLNDSPISIPLTNVFYLP